GGQTLGAYRPNSTPEGSSAGSAVATALGLAVAAIGTEATTFSSIPGPAEFAIVLGMKPSRGLIANDGAIPISGRQDVIGPTTKTARDAAYMLSRMAGRSEKDDWTWSILFDSIPDVTTFCKGTDLTGITVGVPRNTFSADPTSSIMVSFEAAIETLRRAGQRWWIMLTFQKPKGSRN
ncbi:amidase signature domain-containing protein, partial [Schizothecium vesticola]